jgi:hypothetical protein
MHDRTGNLPPPPGIFPDYAAPIVRNQPEGRELTMARWGMPSPAFALEGRKTDPGVTNVRNTASPHWRRWLGVLAAPGPRRLRGTAAASLCSGTGPSAEGRRDTMQSGGHGVRVPRILEGPALTARPGGHTPQPAIRHIRAGHSHRNRAVYCGADQRSVLVRPWADHRSIQGGGGSAGHARRWRGAGPA